jgi:hypothetical protein
MAETEKDAAQQVGNVRAKLQEYANRDSKPEHSLFPRTLLALLDSAERLEKKRCDACQGYARKPSGD